MSNDAYVILRKGLNGQYSSIGAPMGKQKAHAWVLLLKINKPGKYLLLNSRTNIIEESENRKQNARA